MFRELQMWYSKYSNSKSKREFKLHVHLCTKSLKQHCLRFKFTDKITDKNATWTMFTRFYCELKNYGSQFYWSFSSFAEQKRTNLFVSRKSLSNFCSCTWTINLLDLPTLFPFTFDLHFLMRYRRYLFREKDFQNNKTLKIL